jgi:hypothetical protein
MGTKVDVQKHVNGSSFAELLPDEQDLPYEEELLRNPYSVKLWMRYLDAKKGAPSNKRYIIYERALKALPGSYKVSLYSRFPSK